MSDVLTLAGSPSHSSRSSALLAHIRDLLSADGWTTSALTVRDLPAEPLLFAQADHPVIQAALREVAEARAVIIATPVYKASYTGVLKAFLDLLPQAALANKVVFPIATGGSPAHLLVIDYALKPVLSALGAEHVLNGLYVQDAQLEYKTTFALDAAVENRLHQTLQSLSAHLRPDPEFAIAK